MPYIKPEKREELNSTIDVLSCKIIELCDPKSETEFAGILNYCISRLITEIVYVKSAKLRYWHSALIRGVLSDVADEFYRRVVAPYEDKQIDNNGDIDFFERLNKETDFK